MHIDEADARGGYQKVVKLSVSADGPKMAAALDLELKFFIM
jgi:hypothetical protein